MGFRYGSLLPLTWAIALVLLCVAMGGAEASRRGSRVSDICWGKNLPACLARNRTKARRLTKMFPPKFLRAQPRKQPLE